MFHRIHLAVANAIGHCRPAQEVFDVAKVMGSLFGVGDGRVLLRATCDLLGHRPVRVPDQGGGRKVTALTHAVTHLTSNLKAFSGGMHARLGAARGPDKSGAQSITRLIGVGRRLLDVNFVVFALAVGDTLRVRICPFAGVAQVVDATGMQAGGRCNIRSGCARVDFATTAAAQVSASSV